MAKPRGLPPAEAILALADGQRRLTVRVVPGARADAIVLPEGETTAPLQLRITQIAEHGKANAALIGLLAKALGLPGSALEIVRGATSRTKVIQLPH